MVTCPRALWKMSATIGDGKGSNTDTVYCAAYHHYGTVALNNFGTDININIVVFSFSASVFHQSHEVRMIIS